MGVRLLRCVLQQGTKDDAVAHALGCAALVLRDLRRRLAYTDSRVNLCACKSMKEGIKRSVPSHWLAMRRCTSPPLRRMPLSVLCAPVKWANTRSSVRGLAISTHSNARTTTQLRDNDNDDNIKRNHMYGLCMVYRFGSNRRQAAHTYNIDLQR